MFITLTGMPASGKTSIGKVLETKYGFEVFHAGIIMRRLAEENSLSIEELNAKLNENKSFLGIEADEYIDNEIVKYAKANKNKNIVFDSRLAWFFVKPSFKVFLTVDQKVAGERAFKDQSLRGENHLTPEEAYQSTLKRRAYEVERWKEIYGADISNMKNFNLVLNTTGKTAEQMADKIMEELKKKP